MGNADSQSSVVSPAKPSCSLRFSSRRQEAPSARSWWRSSQGGSRSRSRSSSWHHEHAPIGSWRLRTASPQRDSRGGCRRPFGYPERAGGSDGVCGSPKVLLSKNGSMRVEFTNRVVPIESQGFTGLPATVAPQTEPSLHTSKCSSLSSSGSWYDSPWGAAADLADNVFVRGPSGDNSSGCTTHSSSRTKETQTSTSSYSNFLSAQVDDVSPGPNSVLLLPSTTVYNTCSSSRTEDSGIGDSVILHPDLGDFGLLSSHAASRDSVYTLPAFPTAPDSGTAAAACASSALLDDVIQEEGGAGRGGVQLYSSHTLPCRRTEPVGSTLIIGNNRKDFLKSRIRRLSDWTGSLSRKKRRIQEPRGSDSGDVFTGGLSSGPVVSSTVWSSNPLHTLNQLPPVQRGSSLGLNRSGDDQQQNIYDNFLQELETGFSGPADRTEPSAGNGETLEDEIDGEVELGGGEHLDSLLEKEHSVVRRAGWLSFKPLIGVSKDGKLELAVRRKWKHYWVTLKGCTLLFHETYAKSSAGEQGLCPSYTLLAEDSIMQAVPEHPKREHVFCLSNMYGDVYLFQAANQTDLENWVTAVHSASASRLARREGKEDTLHLLRRQSRSLVHKIDVDGKMKKMAELQLSVIKEPKNRKAVESQIQQWEQNLERLNLDLFRLRCYLSSLQGSELPNPKSLLAVASRPSKSTLGRLGVFSVSSFHALVCSRDGEMLQRRRWSLSGGNNRKRGLPSSLKSLHRRSGDTAIQRLHNSPQHIVVAPPTGRPAAAQVCDEPLASVHGIFSLHVSRPHAAPGLGFQVTGHVDGVGKSHIFVSEVDPLGLSAGEGLRAGDEVLAVNGSPVSGLDLDLMQTLFTHQKLQLLLRRDESPDPEEEPHAVWPDPGQAADPCDPPASPNLHTSTADVLSPDTVPPPAFDHVIMRLCEEGETGQDMDRVHSLYQNVPDNPYSREVGLQVASPTHSSVYQRLRKVIQELVDTERSYVKDLVCLFDLYLTPLQKETFLTKEEMEALFGSLPEMLDFQRVFLQTLEEKIKFCPNLSHLETPEQFKKLLFSLGGSFLYYADHFKLYSGFCANHIKVQKVLERAKTDGAFRHFLETRNPTNQHSACLESYLIKPVQRVLKYPLLLRELVSLTVPESPEHTHLTEALGAMEKVASHINEMQKIYEDYGCVFDQLAAEQNGADKQVTEISMGEFLAHSSVVWLNPLPGLGRLRKEPELTVFVFKQAVVLVYRENSKLKRRMMGTRSADLDPFRFRWLIPVSALQVRPANITGSEDTCVWELVHSRSELEGRPETVFQLCSRDLEMMSRVLRVLRSLLRDRVSAGSLTRTKRSSSWQRSRCSDARRTTRRRAESCRPEGRFTQGETCSEPLLLSLSLSERVGRRSRLCSLTSELEAQLQSLHFSEEEAAAREAAAVEVRWSSGLRQGGPADISSLLDRDFSAQSFSSIINEECFYDSSFGIPKAVLPTLQG